MTRLGKASHLLAPHLSWCNKCLTTWNFVEPRTVNYHNCTEKARRSIWRQQFPGRECPPRYKDPPCAGLFALCQECWNELTPEQRLPYYYDLFWGIQWNDAESRRKDKTQQDMDLMWEEIQTSILSPETEFLWDSQKGGHW